MLLSEQIYSTPGLLPATGRLANSLVAALGPDFVLGSAAYDACRSVVAELRAPDTTGVRRPEDSLAAALESVLYAQMLVLFAPRALPAAAHVAVLVGTLPSRQPALRKAAADTLRHLAERDAGAVLAERPEPALLAALDGESDPATAAQLRATLRTLLEAGAPAAPSRWVALCSEVITAAGPAEAAARGGGSGSDAPGAREEDDDGFGLGAPPAKPPPAPPSPPPPSPGGRPGSGGGGPAVTPRLRTRVFAARCLLEVPPLAAAADARHADPAAAAAHPGGDWLASRAQTLVDLAFRMVGGPLEALRPLGVELLLCVLRVLGAAADPLGPPGARLLALYQAQYVSALRASLAPGAPPALQAAGAALAAAFLHQGLAGGDAAVLDRLLGLLCAPLAAWAAGAADPAQAAYAEWVAAGARVALLEAHAHCAALAAAGGADDATRAVVVRAQGPFLTLLVECWIGLLHDHAVLSTQPPAAAAAHRLALYGRLGAERAPAAAAVAEGVRPALRRAWPAALEAAACTLTHDRTAAYGAAGRERHEALLDLALAGLCEGGASAAAAAAGGRLAELLAALGALRRLTAPRFAREGWVGAGVVAECAASLLRLLRQLAAPPAPDPAAAAAAVEAAAETLQQLALAADADLAAEAREDLLEAAEECIQLGGASAVTLAGGLGVFGSQAAAAAGSPDDAYVPLLQRSLAAGVQALHRGGDAARLAVASEHLAAAARAAALRGGAHGSAAAPPAAEVLSAAAVSAAQEVEQAVSGGRAAQVGAGVACVLALGAVATRSGAPASASHAHHHGTDDEWGDDWAGGEAAAAPPPAATELPCSPEQQACLCALRDAAGAAAPAVRLSALAALRCYLQGTPPPHWAAQCAAAALPAAAAAVHAAVQGGGAPLEGADEVQAAGEALKVGLLASTLGGAAGAGALAVVVPLLVEVAAPPGPPTPALAQLAVRLLTALASGPAAAAFRAAVAALPAPTKLRLQGALAAAAAGGGGEGSPHAAPAPAGLSLRPPSIQLKAFGGLKKPQ
jgi:hypothetical protein